MDSCPYPAGSVERIETYRKRVELGLPIFSVSDASDIIAEKSSEHLAITRRWKKKPRLQSDSESGSLTLAPTTTS